MKTRLLVAIELCVFLSSTTFAQALPSMAFQGMGSARGNLGKHRMKVLHVILDGKASHLAAPTYAQCEAEIQVPCYGPLQMRNAYGLSGLINGGYTGAGQSIVIIDEYGSPTIVKDLKRFDRDFGLPDPPSFQVLSPFGSVPFNPGDANMVGWAQETTLDVEWAHAIAPGANIVLLTSSSFGGSFSEFLALEQYALTNNLGKIVSQSWGEAENALGTATFNAFNDLYSNATTGSNVTFLASAGDSGSANQDDSGDYYPFPTVLFPASSPWVTAVGGTSLYADANGDYNYETVWNNSIGAGGGGVSQFFAEPSYQLTLPATNQATLNSHRGLPDIAYNADPNTPVLVYLSFEQPGYYLFGGTSSGSPQMAGVVAIANQYAGSSIGLFNVPLYTLGAANLDYFFLRDVTLGNNAFAGVSGYSASPGWDLSTGWGTPNLGQLVVSMAQLKKAQSK